MGAPFATACILSFNRREFLQQMLGTMIAFAGHPLEVIVHDDGSNDPELRKWLYSMVDEGWISTLIANPPGHNEGQGVALNRMFRMAQGDPIIKLDHDLIFREGWLRRVMDILDHNEQRESEPRIGALGLFHYYADHPTVNSDRSFVRGFDGWEQHKDFVGSAMVIPRRAWEEFGPFHEHSDAFAEDAVFKQKITEEGGTNRSRGRAFACGLAAEDLVINQGFGVGPSTLVINDNHDLQTIHKEPKIVYPGVLNGGG